MPSRRLRSETRGERAGSHRRGRGPGPHDSSPGFRLLLLRTEDKETGRGGHSGDPHDVPSLAVFHESLLILRALQGWSSSPRGNRGPERLSSLPEVAQPGRGPRGDGPDSALHVQLGPCRQSRPRAWEPTLPGAPSHSRASSLDKGQRPRSPPCAASATARQGARGAGELRALRAGGWPWRRARHLSPFRPQTW